MNAAGLTLVAVLAAAAAAALAACWRQRRVITALRARPVHPRFGAILDATPPDGIPVTVQGRTALVGAEPPRLSPSRADLPVTPVRAPGRPPWTGEIPVIDDAELRRRAWAREQLERLGPDARPDSVRRIMAALRAMPVRHQETRGT